MQTVEGKKIVIKLPTLRWSFFLSSRFFLLLTFLLSSFGVVYWYRHVRPFLRLSSAHLNAFSATLNSDLEGRILEMGPVEGAFVKRGEVLVSLDRDRILVKKAQAKCTLESIQQQIEFEKERIVKAMDGYLAASTDADLGMGSTDRVQKHLAMMEDAQTKSDGAALKIAAVKAELEALDLELKKTTLTAPFDGVILKRFKNEGEVLSFGDPIYTLCDLKQLWIETAVSEKELEPISVGTIASIRINAYPKKEFKGKVSYIGPATLAKSNFHPFSEGLAVVPVKISIENPDSSLKPGLSAKVALKIR